MQLTMALGMTFITAALITYTIAVWGEQITKNLKPIFVVMCCIGVVCDTTGTLLMIINPEASGMGFLDSLFHGVTGAAAILLMLIHATWAIRVLVRQDDVSAARFHKFSKFVWLFWLVPFLSPMFAGMMG